MTEGGRLQEEDKALAALRARQGKGARYDSPAAPAAELLLARRGTAYFARKLNELSDTGLEDWSVFAGVSRRLIVSNIGYQARSLARIAEAARDDRAEECLGDVDQEPDDVSLGASLPPHALRYLFEHAQTHLNVEWRDLTDASWDRPVVTLGGQRVTPRQTVLKRALAVWISAVALGNGGALKDIPARIRPASVTLGDFLAAIDQASNAPHESQSSGNDWRNP